MFIEPKGELNHPKPEVASIIYSENIKPNNTVVVVGPSASIFHDPTLLLISSLLSSDGRLYIADPISREKSESYDKLSRKIGGVVTGIGGVERILDEIDSLRRLGMVLETPVWLGEMSAAQNIPLPDHSVDVIADHNTSVFLAISGVNRDKPTLRKTTLRNIYNEYSRVLKPGGKLLLQTSTERYKDEGIFEKAIVEKTLLDSGIGVIKKKVDEIVNIQVGIDFSNLLRNADKSDYPATHKQDSDQELLWFLRQRLSEEKGKHFLKFDKPDHWSPDFYIGSKQS